MPDPAAGPGAARFTLPNQASALRPMSAWLVDAVRAAGGSERAASALELAANELVANAIEHAFPDGGAHEIALSLTRAEGEWVLRIVDDGAPFDPLARPDPVAPASLGDAAIGGLGIALARRSVDECRYAREADRNVLTLVVRS